MLNWEHVYDKSVFDYQEVKHYVEKDLSYKKYQNAYILPYKELYSGIGGGVVLENGEFIEETALNKKGGVSYEFNKRGIKYSDETVIYIGMFVDVWGHCITDNIRRCWFLKTLVYKEIFANCKLVYVPYGAFVFGNNFRQLLSMIDINSDDLIPITEITQYKNVIVPDECFYKEDGSTRYFTKEYREMVLKIQRHADPTTYDLLKYRKMYFTHSHFAGSRQMGEYKLENFFRAQGFEIIAPEEYTFQEQLNMLASCSCFASTIGSCAHNMMYLKPGSSVILIPRANYLTGYQMAINEVIDLDIVIVDASLSLFVNQRHPWTGPFYYYVSDQLMDYFKINGEARKKYWRTNFDEFREYLRIGTHLDNPSQRIAPEVYYQMANEGCQKYMDANSKG